MFMKHFKSELTTTTNPFILGNIIQSEYIFALCFVHVVGFAKIEDVIKIPFALDQFERKIVFFKDLVDAANLNHLFSPSQKIYSFSCGSSSDKYLID
jgi:hypothetical protein